MNGRVSRVVPDSVLALAVATAVASVIVAATTAPQQRPDQIVVVHDGQTDETRASDGALDRSVVAKLGEATAWP